MIETIPEDLHLAFEDWFYDNFKAKSIKAFKNRRYTTENMSESSFDSSEILNEIVRNYDSMEERFESIIERGSTNEREVGINHLLYFPALGQWINKETLSKIGRLAHKHEFSEWRKRISSSVLGVKNMQRDEINRELLKYYNMLRSTILTNQEYRLLKDGTIVSAKSQRLNWAAEVYYVWDEATETYEFSDIKSYPVGPEDSSGKKNKIYDKTTIYEYNAKTGKKFIFEYTS